MTRPTRVAVRGIALCAGAVAALASPAHAGAEPISTVNGVAPPGTAASLSDMTVMLDTIQSDGRRLLVQQGIRRPGTRAPIHVHDYGGHTCVLSGTITDFVEGKQPETISAGSCYYMPPQVAMTAANLGKEDVRLIDTFVLPPDAPTIIVVEPGWPDLKEPTG